MSDLLLRAAAAEEWSAALNRELASLRTDNERLRAALLEMLHHFGHPRRDEWMNDTGFVMAQNACRLAEAALAVEAKAKD